jgi:hypothetical protein
MYRAQTQNSDWRKVLRAHPSWCGGGCWHNWALFSWTHSDGTPLHIPGQIITFIEFKEEDISKIQRLPQVSGDSPDLHAMIETLEPPLAVAKTHERVVVVGRKQLTIRFGLSRPESGGQELDLEG